MPRHRERASRAIAAAVAIATLSIGVPAARADETVCLDRAPDDREVTRRLEWIGDRLEDGEDDVRRWWSGFVALQTLLVGVNVALLVSADQDVERIDPIVSGLGSALGLSTLFIFYPPILGAGDTMRSLPRATPEERLASLRVAEELLRRSAVASSDVRNDVSAISSIAYTEAASLTLLLLGQTYAAFMQAGGGIVVGLGRMLLHPTTAIDAWRAYAARHPDATCELPAAPAGAPVRLGVSPAALAPAAGGLALTIAF